MKIQTSELKRVLSILKSGLSGGKETTDQSASFVFQDGMAYTYNDEISVRVPFDLGVKGAVGAKEFLALVGKLKGEEVDINFEENELRIKSGRSKAGIRLEGEIKMPLDEIELPGKKEWKALPEDFKQAVKGTLFSTSKDMSTPIFTAIHCSGDILESTDNDRATQWGVKEAKEMGFLLPADAGKSLVKYSSILAWGESGGWIHFKIEKDSIFSCRSFEGEYPDLTPYFEVDGYSLEFPSGIKEILDRAGVFIEADFEQDKLINIAIDEKGLMKVRAEGDSGWFEETIRLKVHGKAMIQFSINPQHLIQILLTVNKAVVGESSIYFESDSFKHVVALEI